MYSCQGGDPCELQTVREMVVGVVGVREVRLSYRAFSLRDQF
jgi:hypothetical protein